MILFRSHCKLSPLRLSKRELQGLINLVFSKKTLPETREVLPMKLRTEGTPDISKQMRMLIIKIEYITNLKFCLCRQISTLQVIISLIMGV